MTGSPIDPTTSLAAPLHPHPARPDRQPQLGQLLDVAHRGVDQDRGGALRLGLGRQQVADQRHRPRLGHRQHEHLARLHRGHRGVDHQVVVLAAAHGARRPGHARAGDDLDQVGVDVPAPAARLVDGRRAQLGQLVIGLIRAHSALTTLRRYPLERLGLADRPGCPTSAARGCRAGRRARRSRSGGTSAPSSPPSPRAWRRSRS